MRMTKAVAIGGALAVSAFAISAAEAYTPPGQVGCPSGMVCIYHGTTAGTGIEKGYNGLGVHNIALKGQHLVINDLWDSRALSLRSKQDGKGTRVALITRKQHDQVVNMSDVKSVNLQRHCPVKKCFTKIPQ